MFTPKHQGKHFRKKWGPKVASGALLIGSGIALDKGINMLTGDDQ